MCWGSNEEGQLGNGTTTDSSVPVDVVGLASGVIAISAGGSHTCAVTSDHAVRCWGSNGSGQLGNGGTAQSAIPVDVAGLGSGVSAVAAGGAHSCALTSAGGVMCWGYNEYRQLGNGTMSDSSVPTAVLDLASGASAVVTGDLHSCALMAGVVRCWGYVGSGGLGTSRPADVPGLAGDVQAIAASYERTCALTADRAVQCWAGFGDGTLTDVFGGPDIEVSAISGGFGQTCALLTSGAVRCWGGSNGDSPVEIHNLAGGITAIAAGGAHACALTDAGAVMCWGDNWHGQLGNARACSSWGNSREAVEVVLARPTAEPTESPSRPIFHATGPTDVVLRFDRRPDFGVGDLVGELFQPGPEFTLYGDGTVIFRDIRVEPPPRDGHTLRGHPFLTARLDEGQVHSLLEFALGEGRLTDACAEYGTTDTDAVGSDVITIAAGGVDKVVSDVGSGPFGPLREHLLGFAERGISSTTWVPDRYWGNLLDASIFEYIGDGTTPGLAESGTVPWPWRDISPSDFVPRDAAGNGFPRRILTSDEALVLGLTNDGGVVQRIYLVGPDGHTYYFSLWPMLPDETVPDIDDNISG